MKNKIKAKNGMKDQYFGDINDYRKYRQKFIQRMLKALKLATPGSSVGAFVTPHVVFLMALQPNHKKHYKAIVSMVQEKWGEQIMYWEYLASD